MELRYSNVTTMNLKGYDDIKQSQRALLHTLRDQPNAHTSPGVTDFVPEAHRGKQKFCHPSSSGKRKSCRASCWCEEFGCHNEKVLIS
jgi:hypothetical protein